MLRDLSVLTNGMGICGTHLVGVTAAELPSGYALPGLLNNDVLSSDPVDCLYRVEITQRPLSGVLSIEENGAFSFSGAADGVYSGTFVNYKNDVQQSGSFAFNIGQSAAPLIPAPPTNVFAALVTSQKVSVSFLPSSIITASPVTEFIVSASNGQTATGASSPVEITVPIGFIGTFSVSAKNDNGTSDYSVESNEISTVATSIGDTQAPSMVDGITVDLVEDTVIGFSWQPATDNVGVTNYQYSRDGGLTYISNGTARSAVIGDLTPETTYLFMVRARDDAGNTSDPISASIKTLEAPAPTLPNPTPAPTLASRSYAWLKDAMVRWSHREDLLPMFDDFVMLSEKRINGDLEARLQVAVTTINTTAKLDGVLLPSDIAEISALSIANVGPLEYLPPDSFNAHYLRREVGEPRFYTVFGPYMHLAPTPNAVFNIACAYRQKIPSLLDEADGVNWLVRDHPDIYLSAVMCEAMNYVENIAKLPVWEAKYQEAISAINRVDWNSAATLRIRSDSTIV